MDRAEILDAAMAEPVLLSWQQASYIIKSLAPDPSTRSISLNEVDRATSTTQPTITQTLSRFVPKKRPQVQ